MLDDDSVLDHQPVGVALHRLSPALGQWHRQLDTLPPRVSSDVPGLFKRRDELPQMLNIVFSCVVNSFLFMFRIKQFHVFVFVSVQQDLSVCLTPKGKSVYTMILQNQHTCFFDTHTQRSQKTHSSLKL